MEEEIWKDIPGYEGKYQVSSYGNVRSLNYAHQHRVQVLIPLRTALGYLFLNLYLDGVCRKWFIHILVASTFLVRPDGKYEVDHIDGNPQNNRLENLRWVTHKENLNNPVSLERFRNGSTGRKHSAQTRKKMSRTRMGLASIPIYQISLDDGRIVREYEGATMASRLTGIKLHNIQHCLRGHTRQCGGYAWRYKDPNRINKKYIRKNKE